MHASASIHELSETHTHGSDTEFRVVRADDADRLAELVAAPAVDFNLAQVPPVVPGSAIQLHHQIAAGHRLETEIGADPDLPASH